MKRYVALLNKLNPNQTLIRPTTKIAILLSGQSDFSHSELSLDQKRLLAIFNEGGFTIINMGFPYNQDHAYEGCARASIKVASVRNIQQFFYSLISINYQRLIAKHLQPVFNGHGEIVVICQSLGLNMIKVSLPFLNIHGEAKITLIALGPVACGRFSDKRFKLFVIKGRGDWISIIFDRQRVDKWISCQHMDYCHHEETIEMIRRVVNHQN